MIVIPILVLSFSLTFANNSANYNLQVIATTNNNGEIEPCGWKKKPLGGLARKASVIDEIKTKHDNVLVLDAGNLFFKNNKVTNADSEYFKMTAEIIRDAYNVIGCNAFNVGEKDFAAGLDFLLSLEKASNFPFISSNIYKNNGTQLFKSYEIIELNGRKTAVIGLTSFFNSSEVNIKEPISVLDQVIKEIDSKYMVDFKILLFHSNAADISKFHMRNFDIDLVIQSKVHKLASDGGKNKTPVFSCGSRGKYIYNFDLNVNQFESDIIDLSSHEKQISLAEKKLSRMQKGNSDIPLETMYADDNKKLEDIRKLNYTLSNSKDIINNAVNYLKFEKIELNKKIADRPDILKIVDNGKAKIEEVVGPQPVIPHHNHSHPHSHSHPHVSPRSN